ncbi:MAG: hypothetical protein ACE5K7_06135, partial [Phycisphaerae bacterium]
MLGAMPRWAVVVLATAVALSLAGPVVAADLYVNNNYQGERSGPLGSETNPYGTIDEALDAASDGDTIRIVATGLAYAQGTLEISKQLSLVGHDGMPWIQNSGNSYTMDIYAQNVTLDNLEVDGNGTNSSHIRVAKWADGDNFTLKNCWVHGGNYNGVDLRGIDYPLSNVLIENNIIEDFLGNSDSHGIV